VVGRGNDDGIDFFRFASFAIVAELDDFEILFFQLGGIRVEDGGVDIAERDKLGIFAFQKFTSETFAPAVKADEADAEVAIG